MTWTPDKAARARELLAKATPGPWESELDDFGDDNGIVVTVAPTKASPGFAAHEYRMLAMVLTDADHGEWEKARQSPALSDADLIAAAPTLLAEALDEIERLERHRKHWEEHQWKEQQRAITAEAEVKRLGLTVAHYEWWLTARKRADVMEADRDRLAVRVAELEVQMRPFAWAEKRIAALESALRQARESLNRFMYEHEKPGVLTTIDAALAPTSEGEGRDE